MTTQIRTDRGTRVAPFAIVPMPSAMASWCEAQGITASWPCRELVRMRKSGQFRLVAIDEWFAGATTEAATIAVFRA